VELRKSAAGATWLLRLQHAAGGVRWLDSNALPLFDPAGNVVAFAAWLATSPITACNRNGSHA